MLIARNSWNYNMTNNIFDNYLIIYFVPYLSNSTVFFYNRSTMVHLA